MDEHQPNEETLLDMRRELIETRNLSIKADHALRGLTVEMKALGRRLEAGERRTALNSIASYVLFAALSFAGMFLFFRAAIERNEVDHRLVEEKQEQNQRRLADLEAEIERRRQSERESYAFLELLQSGRRDEVVERFAAIQGRLTDRATLELFRREVDRTRQEVAQDAFREGIKAAKAENWERARDSLLRSLTYVEQATYTPTLRYQLAESLYHLRDWSAAEPHYAAVIESNALSRNDTILAVYHRAECLERSGRSSESAAVYRTFAQRYDYHPWASSALQKAASLDRRANAGADKK